MQSTDLIGWFADIGLEDRPTVGGKGGSLGELTKAGIPVPPGFVVRTAAFERFLEALEAQEPVRSRVEALAAGDLDAVRAVSGSLRARVEGAQLPEDLRAELTGALAELAGADDPVAVRSSATTEDAEDASFAGLQDTFLWVKGIEETLRYVRTCWASLYSVESIVYRRKHGIPEDRVAMAVVVQRMVDARTAGVMFTRSPTTGDRSVVVIEAAWGLGSSVVSGEVTPDRFVIAKITGDISVRDISEKLVQHVPAAGSGVDEVPTSDEQRNAPSVSDEELEELKEIARRVERHYGRPQDIEWAIDRHGAGILLLQSRPETVWSGREAEPVARAAENPLAHVMNIFGGKR